MIIVKQNQHLIFVNAQCFFIEKRVLIFHHISCFPPLLIVSTFHHPSITRSKLLTLSCQTSTPRCRVQMLFGKLFAVTAEQHYRERRAVENSPLPKCGRAVSLLGCTTPTGCLIVYKSTRTKSHALFIYATPHHRSSKPPNCFRGPCYTHCAV